EGPWWINNYLRIDSDIGDHLLTVIYGDSLAPPENFAFEVPLDVTAESGQSGQCEDTDVCGPFERLLMGLHADGESVQMFDGSFAQIGPQGPAVWLTEASEVVEDEGFPVCSDRPPAWYQMLIVGG